jgi:hypothetical protein
VTCVDDHGHAQSGAVDKHVIEQRRLSRAEKTGQDCHGLSVHHDLEVIHGLSRILIVGRRQTAPTIANGSARAVRM